MNAAVIVTGIGVVAPNGLGTEEYWKATLAGRTGIRRIERYDPSRYPAQLAGQITGFEAAEHLPNRLLPQTDRVTRLALVAADWALADAGVAGDQHAEFTMGVATSNASGGFEFTHTEIHKLWTRGPQYVSVYESFAWFYAVNTGQISIRNGMRGPSAVLISEQAGGLDAVGHARRSLRRGATLMVTGGVDSSLDPWGWVSHLASGDVSTRRDPQSAYLPFDTDANGYVPGEGGAILVLEREDSARSVSTVYGRLAGYAATFDPKPGSARPPGLARAVVLALADAGIAPSDVDVVFADGAGIADRDRAEAEAIAEVFGPCGVPVTAAKACNGRLYAGGPPLDLVAALLSMRDGVIPPTPHVRRVPEEYRLDLVRETPRERDVGAAVVLARGRGGFNAAVVVTK